MTDSLHGTRLVISQPMYFPWVGMLEQVRLADTFVFYDDVQFSRGGFGNRVQVKTAQGMRWMTVPLRGLRLGQRIDAVEVDDGTGWRAQHRELLRQAYRDAPHVQDMLALVDEVLALPTTSLSELTQASMLALADYFGVAGGKPFARSSALGIPGEKSQRVLDVCKRMEAGRYITGHGARNYLDHELFERNAVTVEYMDYAMHPYPQRHGAFTPYVSGLDLVANCGRAGASQICSGTIAWRDMMQRQACAPAH
ncbi:WbqC family protein [Cupriavidus sp. 2TAF22]|uniref:WbqC family protein n=1 Tax=unclassified Cupriavidus TaxID=2640874 RepID=UPI003F8DF780